MSATLLVKAFDKSRLSSLCEVIESSRKDLHAGRVIWIDLTVNGDFGEDLPEQSLVGKTVVVDHFQPYEYIGVGVRLAEGVA
jgi:hypothetical protein